MAGAREVFRAAHSAGMVTALDCVSAAGGRFRATVAPVLPEVDVLFANDYEAALAAAAQAERHFWTSETFFQLAEYHLYAALARAAASTALRSSETPRPTDAPTSCSAS